MESNFHGFVRLVGRDLGAMFQKLGFTPWFPAERTEGKCCHFRREQSTEFHLLELRFDKHQRYRCAFDIAKVAKPNALTWWGEERPVMIPLAVPKLERNYFEQIYSTFGHEIAHAPGGQRASVDHKEEGLMLPGLNRTRSLFEPETLLRLRRTAQWTR